MTLGMAFFAALAWGEFAGIIHSARRHSTLDTVVTVMIPPWSWYRSVELFWHDRSSGHYSDVRDDPVVRRDLQECFVMVATSSEMEPNKKFEEAVDQLSWRISRQSPQAREFLIHASELNLNYLIRLSEETIRRLEAAGSGRPEECQESEELKLLRSQLLSFVQIDTVESRIAMAAEFIDKLVDDAAQSQASMPMRDRKALQFQQVILQARGVAAAGRERMTATHRLIFAER